MEGTPLWGTTTCSTVSPRKFRGCLDLQTTSGGLPGQLCVKMVRLGQVLLLCMPLRSVVAPLLWGGTMDGLSNQERLLWTLRGSPAPEHCDLGLQNPNSPQFCCPVAPWSFVVLGPFWVVCCVWGW